MNTKSARSSPAPYLVPVIAILFPIALIGPNTLAGVYACLTLVFCTAVLWRPEEPPALLFIVAYQWLQANILAFYGNLAGQPLSYFAEFPGEHDQAVMLANTGLIALSIGIRLAAGRAKQGLGQWLKSALAAYPARVWILTYVATWLFSFVCSTVSPYSGGLRQPLLILAELKWAAFLLLTASTFAARGRSKVPFFLAFGVELIMSVGGFFGDFKMVFYYAIIGLAFLGADFFKRHLILLILGSALTLVFAVAWTAVKRDYRDYISQGTREQVVLVGYGDRMQDLFNRVAALDGPAMVDGADRLVQRISYYEFFGVVLRRQELGQPYTGGEIWGDAMISPLMPRLLFPGKPVIDDTKLTIKYTGINPAAWSRGVSVSMGYMAEAFLDFGSVLMFAAIGALGALIGGIYRWLLNQRGMRLVLGVGLAPMAVMQAHLLEISILKLLPALVLSILGCWVALGFLGPLVLKAAGAYRGQPSMVQRPA